MKIATDTKTLRDALTGLRKTINNMPKLRGRPPCVTFAVREGRAFAAAGDMDEYAARRLGASGSEGAAALKLADLAPLAKGDGRIEIESDGETALLRSFVGGQAVEERVERLAPDEALPPVPECSPAPGILAKLRRCAPFVSQDPARASLAGVCLDSRENRVVASDGRRLTAIADIGVQVGDRPIVPATPFIAWRRLGDDARIGFAESSSAMWVRIETGEWIWQARCPGAEYPNWRQVVPDDGGSAIELGAADAAMLLRALPGLPGRGRRDRPVALRGSPDGVFLLAPGPDGGWPPLRLAESSCSGPGGTIALNRDFLADALAAGFGGFRFGDELSPAVFEDLQGSLHVLMPLRIDVPEAESAAKAA